MRSPARLPLGLFAAAIVACGPGALDPSEEEPSPAGISFGLEEGTFGAHYADQRLPSDPNPLTDEFAVAVPDSVDGLVLLAYDGGTSNLFILQVSSTAKGTYACGPVTGGHPCHARFFENVREQDGVVEVEGRLDLTSGTLTLSQVGPDDVTGAFEAHFERTGGQGGSTIDVFHGTIAVDLLQGPVEKGGLGCLVALTVGATECS